VCLGVAQGKAGWAQEVPSEPDSGHFLF
jgi:hypothetical protein